ncbi:MBL fold metallo-hydrolase [Oceanicoccus sagamiensis]|uniref:Metallo-beta-lactamase domain-containing protein n=1 Tax=Oceanicoccus sagamiensis TaxID=716816 RepID=A0A1X9NBR8_9GAMM|nr:MBL fold metallo-hydrolase [Oceanicoccus sagamiensis]ARN74484.1 hypothetical protein BST96_10365 [Oceanicoccus sagamiensis]
MNYSKSLIIFLLLLFSLQTVAGLHAGKTRKMFMPGVPFYETEDLGGGLYAFRYGPYRNIFVVGDDGVIATDPIDVRAAKPLREEIAKITDLPVKYVAYSHSHWDHASGGQIFKQAGAEFVAQQECAKNMSETPHPDVVPPDITFDQQYSIKLKNASLDMYYFGPSHDDCMVVMIAKPANILFVVDITSAPTGWEMEYNPTMAEGYLFNMVPYLKAVEALADREGVKQIVSGHMAIGYNDKNRIFVQPSVGPIDAVREKRIFWEILFASVERELAKGTSLDNMPDKLLASPQFKEEFLDNLHKRNWRDSEMWILLRRVGTYVTTGR